MNREGFQIDVFKVLSVVLFCTFLLLVVLSLSIARLNFDEGYNLQIPLNLIRYRIYGTYSYSGFRILDPSISTGPILLLPVTIVINSFGVGIIQARIISLVFAFFLLSSLANLCKRLSGYQAAAISALLLFAIPKLYYTLGTVMGEGAGMALIFTGFITWHLFDKTKKFSYAVLSGFLWGSAVWAKPSMMMVLFFIGIAFFIVLVLDPKKVSPKETVAAAAIAITIAVFWFILIALFSKTNVSSIPGVPSSLFQEQFYFRPRHHFRTNFPGLQNSIGIAIIFTFLANAFFLLLKKQKLSSVLTILNILSAGWIFWWLFFNASSNPRHLLPGLVFGIPVLAVFLSSPGNHGKGLVILKAIVVLMLVIGSIPSLTNILYFLSYVPNGHLSQRDQARFVEHISAMDPQSKLYGWGWYIPWDIAYLSGRSFGDVRDEALIDEGEQNYLVVTPTILSFAGPKSIILNLIDRCPYELVVKHGEFSLYRMMGKCAP